MIRYEFSTNYIRRQITEELFVASTAVNLVGLNLFCSIDVLEMGPKFETSTFVVERRDFETGSLKFNESVDTSEDREMWYRLACRHPMIGYVSIPGARYRVGDTRA